MTVADFIFQAGNRNPDQTALIHNNMTYGALYRHIRRFAGKLAAMDLKPKSNILILLNNCPSFLIAYFAIMMAGHVTVLADPNMKEEVLDLVENCGIALIITDMQAKSVPADIFLRQNRCIIMDKQEVLLEHYDELDTSDVPVAINDDALILCSSGSTGKAKYIVNSHYTLINALKNYTSTVALIPSYKILAVTPFYHSYCMGSCMLAGLYSGSSFLLMQEFNPKRLLQCITEEKIEVFHGVPYMYELLCSLYNPDKHSLASLKLCVSAGSALPENVYRHFYDLTGIVIHQEYGSTETGTIAINLSNDPDLGYKSVGQALNGVSVKAIMEDGKSKLYMKSEGHSVRYYDSQPTGKVWHRIGDLGCIQDGYIFITGRDRGFINVAGKKVDPNEIIDCLMQHEDISAVQVTGVAHDQYGEAIYAYVETRRAMTYQDIVNFCKDKIAAYKIPHRIEITTSMPKSGLNKAKFRSRS